MREPHRPLIVLVVLVAAAVVVLVAIRWGSRPAGPVTSEPAEAVLFDFDDVAVASPDLRVGRARVRGGIQDGFSSWLVMMACEEPDGCAGEFAVTVRFHTGSDRREIVLVSVHEAPMGGDLRFQGLQEPPTPIERIDKLILDVRLLGSGIEPPYGVID